MEKMIAEVIVGISHEKLDKIFHYIVPKELESKAQIGVRVLVPFGKSNKKIEGYIIGFCENSSIETDKLKELYSIVDKSPLFNDHMLALAKWMREYYGANMVDCLRCILPSGLKIKAQTFVRLNPDFKNPEVLELEKRTEKEKEILLYLLNKDSYVLMEDLLDLFGGQIKKELKKLRDEKLLEVREKELIKDYKCVIKYVSLHKEMTMEQLENILMEYQSKKNYRAQCRIIEFLMMNETIPLNEMKKILEVSSPSINALLKKDIIEIEEIEVSRDSYRHLYNEKTEAFTPTFEQANVIRYVLNKIDSLKGGKILLHGITGSGKTEVYLQLIEEVIKREGQAIVLIPEISLTPQTVQRFKSRFGEKVAVTHSKLSLAERYDQWKRARDGEVSVMIGPRSAVFTPFSSLKLIIIDEEHENTYKSEFAPKYHAREVAEKRCELTGAVCLIASATPSLEAYYGAKTGIRDLLELTYRANNSSLPQVEIVDMRNELEEGNRSIFSNYLKEEMGKKLKNKEQIILFLNRRGFSNFVSCRKCGYVLKCKSCSISYTYHAYNHSLVCHYCGDRILSPSVCPQCGSKHIRYFGVGTERVENEVKKLFPEASVLRMDLDTTKGKYGYEKIIEQFRTQKADILIGTQMVAKGHDFPNVTLVGILAADLTLHIQDFRSSERTFQLLTQVSGRAGRGDLPGKVIVQTYDPEHYSIVAAKNHDFLTFYNQEISIRKELDYPPFTHIFTVLLVASNEKEVIQSAYKLMEIMKYYNRKGNFKLYGPVPAMISKIKNKYRWRIIIKCNDRNLLMQYAFYCIDQYKKKFDNNQLLIQTDIDPLMIY
ncbi:MAG: primosomal protein N' [Epulopiscium sp.]|nr:primosomal protein N' [Candidatus Epulonipiscium sp.]